MDEPWWPFTDLRYANGDDALRKIAELIRAGCDDPTFIRLLANHIDPDKVTPFGTKLIVKYPDRGSPPKKPDVSDLGSFMWRSIDLAREPAEAVAAAAGQKYRVGRTKCFAELNKYRAMLVRNPELERMFRETEKMLRASGYRDMKRPGPGKA